MDFPVIQTNLWDAFVAIPLILAFTQLTKICLQPPEPSIPILAVVYGLLLSIFFIHRLDFSTALFMGFLYGFAAIGNYAAIRTFIQSYRKDKRTYIN